MTDARLIDFDDSVYMGRPTTTTTTTTTTKRSKVKKKIHLQLLQVVYWCNNVASFVFIIYVQTDREEKRERRMKQKELSRDCWVVVINDLARAFDIYLMVTAILLSLFPNLSHLALCSRPLISISQPRKKKEWRAPLIIHCLIVSLFAR